MKIEKNGRIYINRIRKEGLLIRKMKVNQTLLFKNMQPLTLETKRLQAFLCQAAQRENMKIVTKMTSKGLRVWRYE